MFVAIGLLLLVAAGLMFALGAGLVAVIPLILAVAIGVWLVWAFAGARSPGDVTRKTEPAELLGPGGPDDPDNTLNRGGPRSAVGGTRPRPPA